MSSFFPEKRCNAMFTWIEKTKVMHFVLSGDAMAFFYGIFLFLYELKFFRERISLVHPVLIGWAGIVIVYHVILRKKWKTIPYWKCLAAFSICAGITALINYQAGLMSNIKSWVMVVLPLWSFFSVCIDVKEEDKTKKMLTVLSGAAVVIFVASVTAVCMFLVRYHDMVSLWGVEDFVGVLFLKVNSTMTTTILYGLYVDSNHAAAYSIIFAIYSLILLNAIYKGSFKSKIVIICGKIFAVVNFVVQLCFFPLANSRGGWLSLAVASFAVAFLFFFHQRFCARKAVTIRALLSLFASVAIGLMICAGLVAVRNGMSLFSASVSSQMTSQEEKESTDNDDVEVDSFEKADDGTGSGRLTIWKDAVELFVRKPLFGTGPGNNQYYAAKYAVAQNKIAKGTAVHNSYLELLVGYGVLGTVPLLGFWLMCLFAVCKQAIFSERRNRLDFNMTFIAVLFASGVSALLSCIFVTTTAMYYIMLLMTGFLVGPSEHALDKESAV